MKKLTADDAETRSTDVLAGNIDQLKTLFPEAFVEGGIDFDVLKQLLGGAVDEREEKYGLNWYGKRRARQLALTPSNGTLRPSPEDSVDWDTTQNLMIEGDNLEVLKLLQKSYSGKVKLIYIDPPYNTGKDFVYPDRYDDNLSTYLRYTGQVNGEGFKISSNTEESGRLHTTWLDMMYPRLKLARNLLREDGLLFVSIDDHEVSSLRYLLDEVFGAENRLGQVTIVSNPRGRQSETIATTHEYLLAYGRHVEHAELLGESLSVEAEAEYKHSTTDGRRYRIRGLRHRGNASRRQDRPKMYFPLFVDPNSKRVALERDAKFSEEVLPRKSTGEDGRWEWGPETAAKRLDLLEGVFIETRGAWDVYQREFLENESGTTRTTKWKSVWDEKEINYQNGKAELKDLFDESLFDYPKPTYLLRKLIGGVTSGDDLILDFFAGSGTTGVATVVQNAMDGCQRRYTLVQLPEPLDPQKIEQKVGAQFCDKLKKPRSLAELTKERLRRAARKVKDENPLFAGDLGFRVFKLDSSNIRGWEPDRQDLPKSLLESVDHLKTDRTEADILYELLLKLGLDLCVPIEKKKISGKDVNSIGGGVLLACLADKITRDQVEPLAEGIVNWHKTLAPAGDTTCVFRDSAFADDVAKTNLAAILEQHGLKNVRSL